MSRRQDHTEPDFGQTGEDPKIVKCLSGCDRAGAWNHLELCVLLDWLDGIVEQALVRGLPGVGHGVLVSSCLHMEGGTVWWGDGCQSTDRCQPGLRLGLTHTRTHAPPCCRHKFVARFHLGSASFNPSPSPSPSASPSPSS